jgi:hypothetical protein
MPRLPGPPQSLALAAVLAGALAGCGGSENAADCETGLTAMPCTERTADENARLALDDGDYDRAVKLLAQLVADEPDVYTRYPLLAAAYAGRAGVSVLQLAMQAGDSSGGSGSSLTDALTAFLPTPAALGAEAYAASLADVKAAVDLLNAIPEGILAETSGEAYASSASFQLTLYQSAYAVMYLNQFVISAATGAFDPASLAAMTEADALVVIESLAAAGSLAAGESGAAYQAKVNGALAEIQSQEGATSQEKVQAYVLAKRGGSASG